MGALSNLRGLAAHEHESTPFITDCTNGLRTELSGRGFEQWVAKTSNWLEAEFGAGLLLHVDLRAHWLWPVVVAALDELEGALAPAERADAVFGMSMRPDAGLPVIAVREHPMALPFDGELPPNHLDFFREVRAGADYRAASPAHQETLLISGFQTLTAAELLALAPVIESGQRLALHADALAIETPAQIATLVMLPWASRASVVISDHSTSDASLASENPTLHLHLTR